GFRSRRAGEEVNRPPAPPAIPPSPVTEPTAVRGNMSPTSVNRLADQPWCAEAASDTRSTEVQRLDDFEAKMMGTTAAAQMSMAVLRAALRLQPRLMRAEESQPPPMLPMSAIREMTTTGRPVAVRFRPQC